ncbi:hypothetical protein EVAR_52733_1 [Eumeta japonica]|uniref:Protein MIS12 homolog n=1 Tax=Eumeta variegata TaxID=151549 RepID=A0A4C1Y2M6_EUMVA|nr:hypothetical protein EVAR_52733_1 [Eumeta japonica]
MINSKSWCGGTEEEYQTQHFGFGTQRFQIAMRQMIEQKITLCVKQMEVHLAKSLDLNDTDKITLKRSCDKLICLYFEKAEPFLEEIDSEIEKILNIPANVLLPQDEVQLQQLSDAEYSTLKNEVDELRKRVERGALMDALLSAEDEELASVENVCEMAKQNMAEVDMMFNFFNDHESVKAVQNATQFLRANIPFLKQINNFEFDNAS